MSRLDQEFDAQQAGLRGQKDVEVVVALRARGDILERDAQRLTRSAERLRAAPRRALERQAERVERAHERLRRAPVLAVERKRAVLESTAGRLRVLSPLKTLQRGYAIVRTESKVVTTR